jgi:hypothetical protein
MFGKNKNKINGKWDNTTASHLYLIANNFLLEMRTKLAEKDQINWKEFEKDFFDLIKDAADLGYNNANDNKSLLDKIISTPYYGFTTYSVKKTPINKEITDQDLEDLKKEIDEASEEVEECIRNNVKESKSIEELKKLREKIDIIIGKLNGSTDMVH